MAYLRDTEQPGSVAQAPVSQLVCQDSSYLLSFTLFNQGIVDDNVLLPGQTEKVGVAVRASLATINDIQLRKRELELGSQRLHRRLQFAGFQRSELVEQRCDKDGPDGDHKHLKTSAKEPQVVEELLARLLDDCEETSKNWRGQDNGEAERLDTIRDEELRSLLVETEFLLKDKSVVYRRWQRQNLVDESEGQHE